MNETPPCPQCQCVNTYPMDPLIVCPECAFEWVPGQEEATEAAEVVIRDAVGNVLSDGDTVTIVKDLKPKGSSKTLKVGTRVSNIRIVAGPGGHDVEAKVEGFGPMYLKSSIMKKA